MQCLDYFQSATCVLLRSLQCLLCPRARTPLTTYAACPRIQLAGGAGHEGEGGYGPVVVLLGDLLLAASQSVTAAAERGRDVGDGGIQLWPEEKIGQ